MDNNHISVLPPSLHTLSYLTHLSLAHNLLSALPSLLPQLEYLDVSYNLLASLDSLKVHALPSHPHILTPSQHCVSLVELYASGNVMTTTRALFPLKSLSSLAVCDLAHNPVSARSEYRHFVVYHCTSLKALDGTAVVSRQCDVSPFTSDLVGDG